MSLYRYELMCPRCAKSAEHISRHGGEHFTPRITCGDCLLNGSAGVVEFAIVAIIPVDCAHEWEANPEVELVDVCSICGEERL